MAKSDCPQSALNYVPGGAVGLLALGLVAAAKARQIGHHHAVPSLQPPRQPMGKGITPTGGAMQAQPGHRGIVRSFVHHGHAQARQGWQVAAPLRGIRPVRQIGERTVGVAQRCVLERVLGQGHRFVLRPALLKELRQHGRALRRQHTALHPGLVVDGGIAKHIEHRTRSPGLGLDRAVDHGIHARVQHGATAHGAGLQRHIQGTAIEPVVAQAPGGIAQGQDLGMGGGVAAGQRRIRALAHDLPVLDDHRAHRHLAGGGGLLRQTQGMAHPMGVVRAGSIHRRALSRGPGPGSAEQLDQRLQEHRVQQVDEEGPHHGHDQERLV